MAAAADHLHPISASPPVLYIQLHPPDARPPVEAVIHALGACTPFRFHNHTDSEQDSTSKHPRFRQIEFRHLESAQKAYATIQNVQLHFTTARPPPVEEGESASPIRLSLSINEDPSLDPTPPTDGTLLLVSELPSSYCAADPLYDLFKPFGPIYRIHIGPRLGTARIIYYNKQSAKAAEDELHFSDLDGISIIVRKPSIYDIKDSFKISTTFPIMPFLSRRAFSAGSPSSITSKLASGNSTADTAHRDTSTLIKRTYNHASGHRATCGIGPVPYGLSAKAEPFTPKNPSSNSGNQTIAHEQPDEASLNNPIIIRSVSQPLKFMHPCQLILYNVPLNLNAQSFYLALRNTLLKKCPGESIKLLEATIASDTATGISQGIGFVKLENTLQTDLAMKVLNGAYLSGYEEEEGLLPLQVKIFSPKEIIEEALFKKRQQEDDQSMKEDNEKKRLGASSSVISISSSSSTSSSKPNKYLNLLSIALNDIDPMTSKGIFTSNREKLKFSNLLMDKLPEDEIKKCILEENYLIKKCLALKILFIDADDEVENKVDKNGDDNDAIAQREDYSEDAIKLVEKGNRDKLDSNDGSSKADDPEVGTKNPEATFAIRGYDREKSSALCTPHSSSQEAVDTTVGELSASVSSIATCPLKVEDEQKDHLVNAEPFSPARASRTVSSFAEEQEEGMKIEALIKFSAKGIMDLACSANSPIILRNRNQEIIKSVNEFLESIKGLRISTQKQKIGEKIFKVFKTRAPAMRNISKRTVTLLDTEDLNALMHLADEFPDILVAKAEAMDLS